MLVQKASIRLTSENILFPADFTAASDAALPFALAFTRWYRAKLIVAQAVPPPVPLIIPLEPIPAEMDAQWQETQGLVDRSYIPTPFRGREIP